MLFVDNENVTDPRVNLAIEEYVLRHVASEEPILLFYINEPAVIIGRNQNTAEEIDPDYIKENGIHVVRRLSGGGAVFHDLGNLNFSFMTNGRADFHNFAKFTDPVIKTLNELGVPAELKGKSDIFVNGKKISGNAQYSTPQRMFSHGTILFDTDIETMLRALNPRQVQIESKAVQSVRSFVTNIREQLPAEIDITSLKQRILETLKQENMVKTYTLTAADWQGIEHLKAERYGNWDWNFGASPKFNLQNSGQFPAGKIDVRLDVEKGRIQSARIFGTFAGQRDITELQDKLIGLRYDKEALTLALADEDLSLYFGELDQADFLSLL